MSQELMVSMTFADKVRSLLLQHRMSQAELAEAVGTHQPQVSKWLNNGVVPSIPLVLRVARALQVSTDFLLDDDQDHPTRGLTPKQLEILDLSAKIGDETAYLWLARHPLVESLHKTAGAANGGSPKATYSSTTYERVIPPKKKPPKRAGGQGA